MSDSSLNNDANQQFSKCVVWGIISLDIIVAVIGCAYFYVQLKTEAVPIAQSKTEAVSTKPTEDVLQQAIQGLKERGIDVDWVRREDWENLVDKRDIEGLRYLIAVESGKKLVMNTRRIQNSLLLKVCYKGDIEMAKFLIEGGADVNTVNHEGNTPLHWAVSEGHKEIVKLLIKEGADVNKRNNNRDTPLHWAKGNTEVVKLLREAWANCELRNKHDYPSLLINEPFL